MLSFCWSKERKFEGQDHIFISQNALNDMVLSYDRKPHLNTNDITTKTFVIQQAGLVGINDLTSKPIQFQQISCCFLLVDLLI